MIRYLTWRNIFGVLLLAILVMIWPLELIGWYKVNTLPSGEPYSKINTITGHVFNWNRGQTAGKTTINGYWERVDL